MNTISGITEKTTISANDLKHHMNGQVQICGSIYKIRKMKDFAFVLIRASKQILQCIYSKEYSRFTLEELIEESCIKITAMVIPEERSKTGYDLHLLGYELLSKPKEASPIVINNKCIDSSIENLLHYRPITLRNEKERAIFRIQAGITNGIREYLQQNNFIEIHTPKIVHAGVEGGANIFKLDYFGKEAYLAQSPQFYKQMMVGVHERVYEIAPVFRAEKHDTSRHLNEYTSVDFEMGYIDGFEEIMQTETAMLKHVMKFLEENHCEELALLKADIPAINEIPVVRFAEAKELVAKAYNRPIKDMEDFEPEEEKLLCEQMQNLTGSAFVFVTHYPSKKRPFYAMDCPKHKEETLSFDLLFRGLEITTGGQRIHDYDTQVAKMQERGMTVELFESYLMMHKYGMPPHGGLGLGLERFTAKLLGFENVRYATLFPRDIHRLEP